MRLRPCDRKEFDQVCVVVSAQLNFHQATELDVTVSVQSNRVVDFGEGYCQKGCVRCKDDRSHATSKNGSMASLASKYVYLVKKPWYMFRKTLVITQSSTQ